MEEFPTDRKSGVLGYTNDFSWRNDPLGAVRICGMTADWAAQQSQRSQIFRNSSILSSIPCCIGMWWSNFLIKIIFQVYIGQPHMVMHGRVSYLEFQIVSHWVFDEALNVKLSYHRMTYGNQTIGWIFSRDKWENCIPYIIDSSLNVISGSKVTQSEFLRSYIQFYFSFVLDDTYVKCAKNEL